MKLKNKKFKANKIKVRGNDERNMHLTFKGFHYYPETQTGSIDIDVSVNKQNDLPVNAEIDFHEQIYIDAIEAVITSIINDKIKGLTEQGN